MKMFPIVLLIAASLAFHGVASSQAACEPCIPGGGAENCIRFHNTETVGGPVEFPNFRSPGGNVDGDALWKIYPKELLWRASGKNCISGLIFPLHFNGWQPSSTYMAPGFQFRRVKTNALGHRVPDFDAPPILHISYPTVPQPAFTQGWWLIRTSTSRRGGFGNEDVALCIIAPPGVSAGGGPAYEAFHSSGERYVRAPQPSFSGRYNAATKHVELLVPPLTPEPAELMASLCLYEPIVEFAATTSGGGTRVQGEMHFGVGAYFNDLASAGGEIRMRGEQNNFRVGSQCFGIPLLSARRYPASAPFPGSSCVIDVGLSDPFLTILLDLAQFKRLQERYRNTSAWEVFYESDWIRFPADPSLKGSQMLFTWIPWCPPPWLREFASVPNSVLIQFN